jgi:hypothetical protein
MNDNTTTEQQYQSPAIERRETVDGMLFTNWPEWNTGGGS